MRFTWDPKKREQNLIDHGYDFADAEEVFGGTTYTYEDDRMAYYEQRFITLGFFRGDVVSICHTETEDEIHVISFRRATKREEEILFKAIAG
jgi:uncharacterized protein